jgi:transposase-like protein
MKNLKKNSKVSGFRETVKNVIQLEPATILGYHKTAKKCPKCDSYLNIHAGMVQLYFCPKCGYSGPIGLNPKSKKKFQEAVKDMKNFMKSKK